MAATIPVETESGIDSGRVHPHNGYYAGDFTSARSDSRSRGGAHPAGIPSGPALAAQPC